MPSMGWADECEIERGRTLYMQCSICHGSLDSTISITGPSLSGVVGRPIGKLETFKFSPAFRNTGGTWTTEKLDAFLRNPAEAIPGGRMAFAGIPGASDRADLICYLSNDAKTQNP